MGRLIKILVIVFVVLFIALSALWIGLYKYYVVPIIMYHNVSDQNQDNPNWVTPKNFGKQINFIKKCGYHVLSLDEYAEKKLNGRKFDRRSVVVTFDDAYRNIYENAYPVLAENKFPATIFVPVERIGKPSHATWEELKEMIEGGMNIGSHGYMSYYLPDVSIEKQRNEFFSSKYVLQEKLGTEISFFSYPIAGFDEEMKEMLSAAGYKGACTTNRGSDRFNNDLYELNRIKLSNKDNNGLILWAKLSGYYNLFRTLKAPY